MRCLVTGATGFIGKNIIEALSSKYTIYAPSHKELELLNEDDMRAFFRSHHIDIVIHTAVRPRYRNVLDSTNQLYNNTRMFFNIVRNSDYFRKMLFLSSGAVYDIRHYVPKMKESYFDTHVPLDEYGQSKYIAAKHVELVDNIIELRIFGIFGKYEDYAIRFISNAISKALHNLPITLSQNRRFDYLYIDDLMPILEYFIHNEPAYKCYNVTPNESVELKACAEMVREISGKDIPILVAQNGMGIEYTGDNARLRNEIPGVSFTPIETSIHKLYAWYKQNISHIDRNLLLQNR